MATAFTKNMSHKLADAIEYARRHRQKIIKPVGNGVISEYHAFFDRVYAAHATEKYAGKTVQEITTDDWKALFYYKLTSRDNFDMDATVEKIARARVQAQKSPESDESVFWEASSEQRQADRQRALDDMRFDMLTWSDERLQEFAGMSRETAQFVRSIKGAHRNAIIDDFHQNEESLLSPTAPFDRPYDLVFRRRKPLKMEKLRQHFDAGANKKGASKKKGPMTVPRLAAEALRLEIAKLPAEAMLKLFEHYGADAFDQRHGRANNRNRDKLLTACIIAAEGSQFGSQYDCNSTLVQRAMAIL